MKILRKIHTFMFCNIKSRTSALGILQHQTKLTRKYIYMYECQPDRTLVLTDVFLEPSVNRGNIVL